jgi:hypothetical protein
MDVAISDWPEMLGDEMQASKAMAWARENTDSVRTGIGRQILEALKIRYNSG